MAATKPLAPGKATIKFDFAYDGGGLGKGGIGTLFVNGEKVAEGRIEHTQAGIFSADETADVGIDLGTPVVEAIGAEAKSKFTGKIPKVTIEVQEMKPADKTAAAQGQADAANARRRCPTRGRERMLSRRGIFVTGDGVHRGGHGLSRFPEDAQAGPRGGGAVAGPRGGEAVEGPRGAEAVEGPRGNVAVEGPRGNVAVGTRYNVLPASARRLVVGDQTYYVDEGGVYYLPCDDDDSVFCVVDAPQ